MEPTESPAVQSVYVNSDLPPISDCVTIKINDQEKKDEKYVVFVLEVKVSDPQWQAKLNGPFLNVYRRYSEFDLLKKYFCMAYPSCLIPPLPDKIASIMPWKLATQKFDQDFLDSRRHRLEIFLKRVMKHQFLSQDSLFHRFIQESDGWRDDPKLKDITSQVEDFVRLHSAGFRLRNPSAAIGEIKSRAQSMQACIEHVVKARDAVTRRQYGIQKLHSQYGTALSELCALDRGQGDGMQQAAHLMDKFAIAADDEQEDNDELTDLLQIYHGYGDSIVSLCRRYEVTTLEMEREEDKLKARRRDKERFETEGESALPGNGGFSFRALKSRLKGQNTLTPAEREQMLERMQAEIDSLAEGLDQCHARLRAFDQQLLAEVHEFEEMQSEELSTALATYCRRKMDNNSKALRHWEKCEAAFQSL